MDRQTRWNKVVALIDLVEAHPDIGQTLATGTVSQKMGVLQQADLSLAEVAGLAEDLERLGYTAAKGWWLV